MRLDKYLTTLGIGSRTQVKELIKKGKNVLYQTAPVLLETVIDTKMNKYKTSNQTDFYKNVLTTF